MLRIITGPWHPDLEETLVEEVRQLKASDPIAPLAIVAPSSTLLARLRRLLVLEHALPLLNVHFLTFHQLALRLYEEGRVLADGADPRSPTLLVEDLFFEQLLRQLARREHPSLTQLRLLGEAPGTWEALWATIRDLKDAAVDPAVALGALGEGLFEPEDTPLLQALFLLYAAVLETGRMLGVGTHDDLAAAVTTQVASSRFLARFQRVLYYGFYDLTQVQLSLFEAVVKCAPVTLYFPQCDLPALTFARRFFERHLLPLAHAWDRLVPRGRGNSLPASQAEPRQVQIISAVGPEDELTVACKEILTLVETHGYRFDEIGVVARTLEPYSAALHRVFGRHRIPFTSTAAARVTQEPVVKALLQLAWLPVTGFYREPIMDLLTSPFYRGARGKQSVEPRPDLWVLAVQALGITRGEEEWERLAAAGERALPVGLSDESDGEPTGRAEHLQIEAVQLRLLSDLVSQLIADCRALPAQGHVAELTDAFAALASKHLHLPGLTADATALSDSAARLEPVWEVIRATLDQLCQLDRIGAVVNWEEWARIFMGAIERSTVPIEPDGHPGVLVLDAMAARGLPFRALFLLGLNEKVFPRFIREDAFLRDRHRRILAETLGYKIDEKLTGHEEEQLLFTLLLQAARHRLYLLYQRADAEGRSLVPSAYLAEVRRTGAPGSGQPEVRVPRRLSERVGTPPFLPALLTPEELALWLLLQDRDPGPILKTAGETGLFQNGWEALRQIEGEASQLGPYDGITGVLHRHWAEIGDRGIAPTSLERYARCPFQYFAAHALRLEPLRHPAAEELQAQTMGELCHAALRGCCQRLVEAGWPERELAPEALQEQAQRSVEDVFAAHAAQYGTGYALTRDLARETIVSLVTAVLEEDQLEYRVNGFKPIAFEFEANGVLSWEDLPGLTSLKLRGRLDRMDGREAPRAIRIVDYKYKQSRDMKGEDRDLLTSGIRGHRLQPALYARMTVQDQPLPEQVEFRFLAPRWAEPVTRSHFDPASWHTPAGGQLRQTLRILTEGIRSGQYFILPAPPGGYCDHCDFSAACRRFHGPTWWRAHRSPSAQRLRQLRKQKVGKNSDE